MMLTVGLWSDPGDSLGEGTVLNLVFAVLGWPVYSPAMSPIEMFGIGNFEARETHKKKYLFMELPCSNGYIHLNNSTLEMPGTPAAFHPLMLSSSTGTVQGSFFCLRAVCREGNYFV